MRQQLDHLLVAARLELGDELVDERDDLVQLGAVRALQQPGHGRARKREHARAEALDHAVQQHQHAPAQLGGARQDGRRLQRRLERRLEDVRDWLRVCVREALRERAQSAHNVRRAAHARGGGRRGRLVLAAAPCAAGRRLRLRRLPVRAQLLGAHERERLRERLQQQQQQAR